MKVALQIAGYLLIYIWIVTCTLALHDARLAFKAQQQQIVALQADIKQLHTELAELRHAIDTKRWAAASAAGRCAPDLLALIDAHQPESVPLSVWRNLIWIESRCQPHVMNKSGAVGLAGVKTDTLDPDENLAAGAALLSHYMKLMDGNLELGLSAYGGWYKRIVTGGVWTREYARAVMEGL